MGTPVVMMSPVLTEITHTLLCISCLGPVNECSGVS